MQKKSDAAQAEMWAGAQSYSILVIDKKMMKMKKATFVQNLKLSQEEMEKFWPIYAQYDKEIDATIEKRHHLMSKYKEKDLLEIDSETAKMLVEQNNKIERELSEIKISYYEKFLSILPAQKVAKLIKEEKQMMRNLRKKDRQESKPQETLLQKEQNSLQLVPKK